MVVLNGWLWIGWTENKALSLVSLVNVPFLAVR